MIVSELITTLEEFKEQSGDLEVVIDDADTGWLLDVKK